MTLLIEFLADVMENEISLAFIRRVSRHCFRFMSGYRIKDLEGPLLDIWMKKYSRHRSIPPNVLPEEIKKEIEGKNKKI